VNAPADEGDGSPRPGVSAGIGVVLLLLAAVVLLDAQRLPPASGPGVGPGAAMQLVAAFVGVLGLAHLVVAWQQRSVVLARRGEPANHRSLGWVLGALAGLMLILQLGGGFIAASAWLFVLTARGFGAPVGVKSVAIGVVLSSAVFVFFTKALSLGLPAGPLERLIA
jgi:putative tricarboxylic transport membrane protein